MYVMREMGLLALCRCFRGGKLLKHRAANGSQLKCSVDHVCRMCFITSVEGWHLAPTEGFSHITST